MKKKKYQMILKNKKKMTKNKKKVKLNTNLKFNLEKIMMMKKMIMKIIIKNIFHLQVPPNTTKKNDEIIKDNKKIQKIKIYH